MITSVEPRLVEQYVAAGWWGTRTLGEIIRKHAATNPDGASFVTPGRTHTWAAYDVLADEIAGALVGLGLRPGDMVAVLLPDGLEVHAALIGAHRAGNVAVGIGARAGDAEIAHLVRRTGARVLITAEELRGRRAADLARGLRSQGVPLDVALVVSPDATERAYDVRGSSAVPLSIDRAGSEDVAARSFGPNDVCMLNSTSGTTGLPKCVIQFENRWMHFSDLATSAGALGDDEVFLGAIPAPFGFGLWTSHFAPTILGAPCVVMPKFNADQMVELIERERVTVLCCVSTQFRMLLNSPLADRCDLSSLRVMFTGGEAVPYDRAAEFEDRTGAKVLQFFGSNESGAFSMTTLEHTREQRLLTAGEVLPHMEVRLFDDDGSDVTGSGGPGQPGGRGPLTCLGYYDDPAANAELLRPDGWLLMGDLVTLDDDGFLALVGRKSDIVIRGGKNISAAQVEGEVETHPSVALVSVVPVADALFGERVCAVVCLHPGAALDLDDLTRHLLGRGLTPELCPEHLVVLDDLPRSSGGKLAKGEIRALAERTILDRRSDPAAAAP